LLKYKSKSKYKYTTFTLNHLVKRYFVLDVKH